MSDGRGGTSGTLDEGEHGVGNGETGRSEVA